MGGGSRIGSPTRFVPLWRTCPCTSRRDIATRTPALISVVKPVVISASKPLIDHRSEVIAAGLAYIGWSTQNMKRRSPRFAPLISETSSNGPHSALPACSALVDEDPAVGVAGNFGIVGRDNATTCPAAALRTRRIVAAESVS